VAFSKLEPVDTPVSGINGQAYRMGQCSVIMSQEPFGQDGEYIWHLSIGHPNRFPTWDEINNAEKKLRPKGVTMGILFAEPGHPAHSYSRNICHLWEIEDNNKLGLAQEGEQAFLYPIGINEDLYNCPSCRSADLAYGQQQCPVCHLHLEWTRRAAMVMVKRDGTEH
jgi:hypothetical protein